ncbi:daunorubicin resistance protein DrrA family ABC transporter ATP-binding protein [Pseudonocardia sulfidoxydans NBRC 16205]|uniref:Daunorubicin resistance protein DrrA family ABC transporter ATP-binding protein n=1 Tax=Pseudonocardia sulfidoxydans NBRC 16205 TaxID=1223511 RepID=A0A511DLY5_9PSEU|nr:ATP-binding cassette domain-containing protein [Pseudonocardia sulfidoxydans]GEL25821.1 daunorubicin resistance protein DrrA family ABC transporter ATP-binding protein [Pseudonocardia sulfidoxydans NBRC 16205]
MILEATGLRKRYGDTAVLDGVDLAVAEGSVLALLGPNGAGKTTTVRILGTLTRPDGGSARIAGFDIVTQPRQVREVIALTGQYAAVDAQQTGRENLTMIGRLLRLGRAGATKRSAQLLERFELTGAADRRVVTYSGGMRRRLDLAMSLVAAPRLLFLDEPTAGLDPASRATMWDAVGELVCAGTTVVLTTQYLEEADRLADRIVLIDDGRVAAEGSADELKARVGGDRLELWFADRASLEKAAVVLDVPADPQETRIGIPTDGSATELHRVLDALRAANAEPDRVTSHRPTLDDVFVGLTRRTLTTAGSTR